MNASTELKGQPFIIMKKLSFILTIIIIGLVLSGCSYGRYTNLSQNLNLNQTQIVLSEANFKVVKRVSKSIIYKQSAIRFDSDQLYQSAYAELLKEAKLTGSQVLINVTVEIVERVSGFWISKSDCAIIVSGIVIEFITPNVSQKEFISNGVISGGSLNNVGTIQAGDTIQSTPFTSNTIKEDTLTEKSQSSLETLLKRFFTENQESSLIIVTDNISAKENMVLSNTFIKKVNSSLKKLSCKFRLIDEKQKSTVKLVISQIERENITAQCLLTNHLTQETITLDLGTGTIEDLGERFARRVKYYSLLK